MTTTTDPNDDDDRYTTDRHARTTGRGWLTAEPGRNETTGDHPDDRYRVSHQPVPTDDRLPERPRPAVDPRVKFTSPRLPDGTEDASVLAMDDTTDGDQETFIVADADDWVALDDWA